VKHYNFLKQQFLQPKFTGIIFKLLSIFTSRCLRVNICWIEQPDSSSRASD